MFFNFLSKFPHYKKYSASWYRKCKIVWCKALATVFRLKRNINIQVRFSKNPQNFGKKFFMRKNTERATGMMSLTVAFRKFGTPFQTRHGDPDSFVGMCRMRRFLDVLRIFFTSSILYTLYSYPFPATSLPSSLTSSCLLLLGLPLNFVYPKFTYNILWGILLFCFIPFSLNAKTNVIYWTLLSLLQCFFKKNCINFITCKYYPINVFTVKYWA